MERLFWILGVVSPCLLLAALAKSRQWRVVPIFSAAIAYQALKVVVMYPVERWGTHLLFVHMYWTLAAFDYAMQVLIMVELARLVLRSSGAWITGTFRYFIAYVSTVTFASGVITMSLHLRALDRNGAIEARWSLFTSLLTCGLTLATTSAANRLRLRWAPTVLAIARGFAIWSTASVLVNCFEIAKGWDSNQHPNISTTVGAVWFVVCLYWTIAFWFPKKEFLPEPDAFRARTLVLLEQVKDDKQRFIM